MWTATQADNLAAQRTYERAGGHADGTSLILEWALAGAPAGDGG